MSESETTGFNAKDSQAQEPTVVQLGFAEKVEEDEHDEAFGYEAFPSKIGGRPVSLFLFELQ
jgi:hypothetical protein